MADKIKVLAGGAVRVAVVTVTEAFGKSTGTEIELDFATAPVATEKIESGGDYDVAIVSDAVTDRCTKAGLLLGNPQVRVGSIPSCVVVRGGVPHPDLSTVDSFCEAIRNASAVIFNVASSGIYIEKLMDKLGLADEIADKVERTPTGNAVMARLEKGSGDHEIGFGQRTEILRSKENGADVELVGALPDEIGNMTTFVASPLAKTSNAETATNLVRFFDSPEARKLISAAGLV
jgi:molybdate transport system substrate-binding protein